MLLDFGWSELMLIGVVALVVIGPKDLPRALKVAGYWMRKARTLSREFQNSVEQMIRDAELDDVRQDLKKMTEIDFNEEFRNTIDPSGELAEALRPPELANPLHGGSEPAPATAEPVAVAHSAEHAPEPAALPAGEHHEGHPAAGEPPTPGHEPPHP